MEEQVNKLEEAKKANAGGSANVEPMKEEIKFEDFMKMDMRVGTVLTAEKVKKSNKLLKLTIDTGIDKRTILSGIAKHFKAEEVVGKQVTVLVNLAPRPMMGEVSEGMVLMAEDSEGNLQFVQPGAEVNPGSTIA